MLKLSFNYVFSSPNSKISLPVIGVNPAISIPRVGPICKSKAVSIIATRSKAHSLANNAVSHVQVCTVKYFLIN